MGRGLYRRAGYGQRTVQESWIWADDCTRELDMGRGLYRKAGYGQRTVQVSWIWADDCTGELDMGRGLQNSWRGVREFM
jgi:hypothetical protein